MAGSQGNLGNKGSVHYVRSTNIVLFWFTLQFSAKIMRGNNLD